MHSWSNLVLMCGLVFIASLTETSGRVIPRDLEEAVRMLRTKLKLTGIEWLGKAVFSQYLGKLESTCTCEKMVLMSMLNVYLDIFEDMKIKDTENEKSLNILKTEVVRLRANGFVMEQAALQQLQQIASIDAKNSTIQGGALNNFELVYDKASTSVHRAKKSSHKCTLEDVQAHEKI